MEQKKSNFWGIINYREVIRRDGGVSAHQESRACGDNALLELRLERQREYVWNMQGTSKSQTSSRVRESSFLSEESFWA
jgi:hypothetical protein